MEDSLGISRPQLDRGLEEGRKDSWPSAVIPARCLAFQSKKGFSAQENEGDGEDKKDRDKSKKSLFWSLIYKTPLKEKPFSLWQLSIP